MIGTLKGITRLSLVALMTFSGAAFADNARTGVYPAGDPISQIVGFTNQG